MRDLAEEDEDGVDQLVVFGEVKDVDEKVKRSLVDLDLIRVTEEDPAIKVVFLRLETTHHNER